MCRSQDWVNAGLAEQLFAALAQRGHVTIRLADLGELDGLTDFRRSDVVVDHRLNFAGFRCTVTHELTHLRRGPVPEHLADAEEIAVRHETADVLLPALRYAARHRETVAAMTDEQLRDLAVRAQVDPGVARDAISPPTMPLPVIPAMRAADGEGVA